MIRRDAPPQDSLSPDPCDRAQRTLQAERPTTRCDPDEGRLGLAAVKRALDQHLLISQHETSLWHPRNGNAPTRATDAQESALARRPGSRQLQLSQHVSAQIVQRA